MEEGFTGKYMLMNTCGTKECLEQICSCGSPWWVERAEIEDGKRSAANDQGFCRWVRGNLLCLAGPIFLACK